MFLIITHIRTWLSREICLQNQFSEKPIPINDAELRDNICRIHLTSTYFVHFRGFKDRESAFKLYTAWQLIHLHINKNKNNASTKYMYPNIIYLYVLFTYMVPKINWLSRPGERNFFTIQHRSQLGNVSYTRRKLPAPNRLKFWLSICILQFFQVKLPLQ